MLRVRIARYFYVMTIWLKMLFRMINKEKGRKRKTVKRSKTKDAIKPIIIISEDIDLNMDRPENYTVEGSEKEVIRAKKVKSNTKRGLGEEYISRKIKKTVPPKRKQDAEETRMKSRKESV